MAELLEGRLLYAAQSPVLSGTVFQDLNGNGVQDAGEPGLAGWTLSLSQFNPDLPQAVTGTNGNWAMSVSAGQYQIRLFGDSTTGLLDNWLATAPVGGVYHVTVCDSDVAGLNFGVRAKGAPGAAGPELVAPPTGFRVKVPSVVSGGETGRVRLRVANVGNALSTGNVPISLYGSSVDNGSVELKAGDALLTTAQPALTIPPGKARNLSLGFTVPAGLSAGDYGIVAVVGPQSAVTGSNTTVVSNVVGQGETRLLHGTVFTVGPAGPDLAVSFVAMPLKIVGAPMRVHCRQAGAWDWGCSLQLTKCSIPPIKRSPRTLSLRSISGRPAHVASASGSVNLRRSWPARTI